MNSTDSRPKKSLSSKVARSSLAALRLTLRPGIERETLLMPWLIAESVLAEAGRWLGEDLPREWSAWLDARAERIYRRNPHFRGLVRSRVGNRGRDALYRFFRHWLGSRLARERRALFRRLPESFALGLPFTGLIGSCTNNSKFQRGGPSSSTESPPKISSDFRESASVGARVSSPAGGARSMWLVLFQARSFVAVAAVWLPQWLVAAEIFEFF